MSKEGLHVVVRNTFLEFSDDTPAMGDEEPRRVRAYSDMTDSKLPVKVELSNSAGFYQVSRHRVSSTMQDGAGQQSGRKGGGRASSGGMDGLTTVMEDQSEYSGDSFGLSGAAFGQGMLPHEQGGAYSGAMGGPPGDLGWMNSLGGPGLSPLPYGTPPPSAWGMGWGGGSGYGGMPPGMPAGFPPGMMPGGMPPYGGYGGQSGSGGFGGHHAQGNMGQGHHDSQQAETGAAAARTTFSCQTTWAAEAEKASARRNRRTSTRLLLPLLQRQQRCRALRPQKILRLLC